MPKYDSMFLQDLAFSEMSCNKIAFQSKADQPWTNIQTHCSCDTDLDPMTLIYDLDLDRQTTYPSIKTDLSRSRPETNRHTDRRDWKHYHTAFTGW